MKNALEVELLERALARNAPPGTVLATFWLDLPQSNGKIHLCVYVQSFSSRPVAVLQETYSHWTYADPEMPKYWMEVPTHIYKYITRVLRRFGIIGLIGIEANDATNEGIPLTKH